MNQRLADTKHRLPLWLAWLAAGAVFAFVIVIVVAITTTHAVTFDGSVDLGSASSIGAGTVEIRTLHAGINDRFYPSDSTSRVGQVRNVRRSPVLLIVTNVDGDVRVELARDTQSGCRLQYQLDVAGYTRSLTGAGIVDPCHGAVYRVDGRCVDGPCPRDLDRFTTGVDRRGHLIVDLATLTAGSPTQH